MTKKSETRKKILEAALTAFSRHGYQGTSIPVLAKEAKIAVGSVYVHFQDKQALVNELYQFWKNSLLRELELWLATATKNDFYLVFSGVWDIFVRFAQNHPRAFLFLESHYHAPYLTAESLAIEEKIVALTSGLIELGQKSGQVRAANPEVLSGIFFGALVQLFKQGRGDLTEAKELLWAAFSPRV